jgi:hypothetical protein
MPVTLGLAAPLVQIVHWDRERTARSVRGQEIDGELKENRHDHHHD